MNLQNTTTLSTKQENPAIVKPLVSGRHKWIDNSGVGYEMCMKCCKRRRSYLTKRNKKRYEYEGLYGWYDERPACR